MKSSKKFILSAAIVVPVALGVGGVAYAAAGADSTTAPSVSQSDRHGAGHEQSEEHGPGHERPEGVEHGPGHEHG
jgi:hypothetical protein